MTPLKIISFSLWGRMPKYCDGILHNIKTAAEIYPGWHCIVYLDATVPAWTVDRIKALGASAVFMPERKESSSKLGLRGNTIGAFWRLAALDIQESEVVISRDCDSLISIEEGAAVNEWLASDKLFHTIQHGFWANHAQRVEYDTSLPVLCGLFGAKTRELRNRNIITGVKALIQEWTKAHYPDGVLPYGSDEQFLGEVVWPKVKDVCLRHGVTPRDGYGVLTPMPLYGPAIMGDNKDLGLRIAL